MELELREGTRLVVRPIGPADKEELVAGLGALSDVSVQRRFLGPKASFTRSELRYLTEVDGCDHFALVAVLSEGADAGRVVGVARFVRLPEDPITAEMAIVVADHLQGEGLGSLLADELVEAALARGVTRFSATMLSDNYAVQRLLSRISRSLQRRNGGRGQQELLAELAAA